MDKSIHLTIAISTKALFDMSTENKIFEEQGMEAYQRFMQENRDIPLKPGPLFNLVKILSAINFRTDPERGVENRVVDFVLTSRNDPITAERAMQAINDNQLSISSAFFLSGESPVEYLEGLEVDFFATTDQADVNAARKKQIPAGYVLPGTYIGEQENTLKLAFDFDCILSCGTAEAQFKQGGLGNFLDHDNANSDTPLAKGPLFNFISKLVKLEKLELSFKKQHKEHIPLVSVSIITARGVNGSRQFTASIKEWGITPEKTFMLGGKSKKIVLKILKPHLFIDDQLANLEPSKDVSTCVHVPYIHEQ